jgi:hypothetical protein
MLEFAVRLKRYREELNANGTVYDERWNLAAEDIELFFKMVGLSGKLSNKHKFVYFPSMNKQSKSNA